ncbi:MAG: alpha/beta fold hydrolase [Sphingomonadales bacterium]|nr:alpha/beta fold hydrolase [Sphingomonadales bacterium]
MDGVRTEVVAGFGGAALAVHRLGAGRPVVLLHGLFSNANVNWIKYGHAARLAEAGFEAVMPDLRAHGASAAPHDEASYPHDVLVRDLEAVISGLGLADYDLGGFSLGARTVLKGVLEGLRPRRLVLGGMGLQGLVGWRGRTAHFLDVIDRFGDIPRDDPSYYAQQFMKSTGIDRVAARLLLLSLEGTAMGELGAMTTPTLVVCGDEDRDNGSPEDLVAVLPDAVHAVIPGTHMGCVTKRQLGEAIVGFLAG